MTAQNAAACSERVFRAVHPAGVAIPGRRGQPFGGDRPIRSSPQLSVQCAETDSFSDVIGGDAVGAFEVGDGAGDFQDAIVGAGAEVVFGHGGLEHGECRFVERAVGFQFARAHARVAGDAGSVFEPLLLDVARGADALADRVSLPWSLCA